MDIYVYTLVFVAYFSALYILFDDERRKLPHFSILVGVVLSAFAAYYFADFPVRYGGDRYNYLEQFKSITFEKVFLAKDIGFSYYTYLSRRLIGSSDWYFLQTAILYIGGYWVFAYKIFKKQYLSIFLIMAFSSFAFTAYGVNTLRAGLALSLLLVAISNYKKLWIFIVFALLAISIHKSMALPAAFFLLTRFYNQFILFLAIWVLALILSIINVGGVSEFLQENLFGFDDRAAGYFETDKTHYKTGFRTEFVIYSVIPILIGAYYLLKLKLEDTLYERLFSTYILTNAIWLLVIRMAFTDRVAYLSWFLIPFLVLYPLLKYDLPLKQRRWVAAALVISVSFRTFMYFN